MNAYLEISNLEMKLKALELWKKYFFGMLVEIWKRNENVESKVSRMRIFVIEL